MAGYLSKIVDRTLGLVPLARPLIPPLFGTGPELAAESAARPSLESEPTPRDEPAQPEGVRRAPAPSPIQNARPRKKQQPQPPEQSPSEPPPLVPPETVLRPAVSLTAAPRLVPTTLEGSSMPSANPPASSEAAAPPAPALSRAREQLIPSITSESTRAAPTASPAQVQPVPPGVERPLPEARLSRTLVPVSEPVKVQHQESMPPDFAPEKPGATQSPAPDQVPTIQVSIGRVEVRAVFKPPASPAQTDGIPRPKISLDEYLRSNSGGAR